MEDVARLRAQRAQFDRVDAEHFYWQTEHSAFARTERDLLHAVNVRPTRFLEIGCGEGGNIANLFGGAKDPPRLVIGVDVYLPKLQFAKKAIRVPSSFVCADAGSLPFRQGIFDTILCRDVLHHVVDQDEVVSELARVCAGDGMAVVVEPNGQNPLMRALGWLRPFERNILKSTADHLRSRLQARFEVLRIDFRQPLPLTRVVFHYEFGLPRLAQFSGVARILRACETLLSWIMPRRWWGYIEIVALRPLTSKRSEASD